ncbi:MAG: hypothetical protein ACREUP_00355, partial [Burkholderiales bacterium]
MTRTHQLQSLSDDELLRRLTEILQQSRRIEADLIAHIGEVDDRRLYAREACCSMFAYCTEVLHLSEAESYFRIAVARAARKHPVLLTMLGEGRLHMSGIAILAPYLTEENCERVLARATYKSKRQIEELVAELAPKTDVPAVIRKLPSPPARPAVQLCPDGVESSSPPDRVPPAQAVKPAPPARPASARIEPLAPERHKVQFTASSELRDKLERLQALMHEDLAAAIEAAVTEKLERLEAKRYAETKRPRKNLEDTDTSPSSRYIPAPVRRAVRRRDGDRCGFVDQKGRRCTECRGLEFHHHEPFGRGGAHNPDTISLRCRTHNAYLAERDYGKDVMDRYRRHDGRVSEPRASYDAARVTGLTGQE